jgi:hypothetical protein
VNHPIIIARDRQQGKSTELARLALAAVDAGEVVAWLTPTTGHAIPEDLRCVLHALPRRLRAMTVRGLARHPRPAITAAFADDVDLLQGGLANPDLVAVWPALWGLTLTPWEYRRERADRERHRAAESTGQRWAAARPTF